MELKRYPTTEINVYEKKELFSLYFAGTPTTDVQCEKCGPKTYSDLRSSTQPCQPFSDCSMLGGVKDPGNSSKDNVCYDSGSSSKLSG